MPRIGRPLSNSTCGARGLPSSGTLAGEPDRMMPLGLSRWNASSAMAERGDFGIDPGLAHAAGDQLGHLAAEIDDEDGIGEVRCVHAVR